MYYKGCGGATTGDYHIDNYLGRFVDKHGAMGSWVYDKQDWYKMGDTPTVLYLFDGKHGRPGFGNVDDPSSESWAGKFSKPKPDIWPTYWSDIGNSSVACRNSSNKINFYGGKTMGSHRRAILDDWKLRMDRIK